MVGALRKLAYSGPSHRSKPQYPMVEGTGGKRICPAAALHGVPLLENFEAVEHPAEPAETDDPVRCPPPENCIRQDGMIWRARVAKSFRRPMDRTATWHVGDTVHLAGGVSTPSLGHVCETSLVETHSAPEIAVQQMLM